MMSLGTRRSEIMSLVEYKCEKGYSIARVYSTYPPNEVEQLVVSVGWVFESECKECEFGQWKNYYKTCWFKRVHDSRTD